MFIKIRFQNFTGVCGQKGNCSLGLPLLLFLKALNPFWGKMLFCICLDLRELFIDF